MFNMISINLIGNETLSKLLRALTVYTLIKYRNQFMQSIQREEYLHNNITNINETTNNKFNSILTDAKTNKCWCNEYHPLALSTLLNTDIYIYSTFYNTNTNTLYQHANNSIELQNIFNQGKRTGAHLIYEPISNSSITTKKINRYTAFFCLFLKHIYRPYLNHQIKLYKITLFYTIRTIFSP